MLPRSLCLRQRSAFDSIYRHGNRYYGKLVALRCLRVSQVTLSSLQQSSQFAVVVSKKVHRRAVVRNRIKRCIRAQLQQLTPFITPGWQVIVTAHKPRNPELPPPVTLAVSKDLRRELQYLLEEAGVISRGLANGGGQR